MFVRLNYLVLYFCVYLGIFIRETFGDLTIHTGVRAHTHTHSWRNLRKQTKTWF